LFEIRREVTMGKEKRKPILIIEDEAILRESLRDWLTDGGYEVETARDGEEGLQAITDRDFGVVLLDLRLPGKDGIEVLREAKTQKPQLKIIIITAYPSLKTAVQAMKEGAVDYLPKPLDLDDLQKLIDGTLMPVAEQKKGKLGRGEAIATLSLEKKDEGLNVSLVGWEYIDAYLSPKKESPKE
jgi:DNA-binding NtrC family response regulator